MLVSRCRGSRQVREAQTTAVRLGDAPPTRSGRRVDSRRGQGVLVKASRLLDSVPPAQGAPVISVLIAVQDVVPG